MGACPNCKSPVTPGAKTCEACGKVLPVTDGTLEVGLHFDDAPPTKDTPLDSQPMDASKASASDSPKPKSEAAPPATPIAPAAESAKGTLGAPEISDQPKRKPKPSPTASLDNVDLNSGVASDADATLNLPSSPEAAQVPGTVEYGEADLKAAQEGKGESGTAGRLKRLWEGVAGSTGNPLQTLKGSDALASDSVFAQVSPRVLVTDAAIEIVEHVGSPSASQPDRKTRVEECIALACHNADGAHADYDLTGFLGQGAMGVVLKAHQKAIGRDVAIKMIQPSTGGSTTSSHNQKRKFFYEAQITGKLDHPNIVPVYELGISNDVLFYSMKMIVGEEWKKNIQTNTRDENLEILMKVCDAMAFAHQKQIIHRDLKPENVMLGEFGEVLVTDWGCAVDLSRREKFTGAGSAPWMAPEMADHNVSKIGPRSDIYLIGAMLYQIIAGHAPHPGQTVFECLAAAQKNLIIPLDIDDPLLDIAMRAMETEPEDRYSTVESMQAAIREYRRHAESISFTERSEALLVEAKSTKDYQRFSRAIFGLQDAIELWPGNTAAKAALGEARLAYGQCAFGKGDYDLCLQTLNQKIPAEATLYAEAVKAKKTAEERERRVKTLRNAFAAAVLLGLIVSSAFAGIASFQWNQAVAARNRALKSAESEAEQRRVAEKATEEAIVAKDLAEVKSIEAGIEGAIAERQRKDADTQRDSAEKEKGIAEMNTLFAEIEQAFASRKSKEAQDDRQTAVKRSQEAEERSAQIELGNSRSNLALSLGQIQQQNMVGATATLKSLEGPESYKSLESQGRVPKFDNWSLQRVKLLSNTELLGDTELRGDVSAVAFAENANVGIIATQAGGKGNLQVVQLDGKRPKVIQSRVTDSMVGSVAVSPDGDEVVYSLTSDADQGTLYTWNLTAGSEPVKVVKNGRRNLQGLVMTSSQVLGGINGGLWIWDRSPNWSESEPKKIDDVLGRLQSLQLLGESNALVLAEFKGGLKAHVVDLKSGKSKNIAFDAGESEFKGEVLSAIAFAKDTLIIGTDKGSLFTVALPPASDAQKLIVVGPEFKKLPQKHQSAIKSIVVHSDGTLLTTAFEPVVHVWRAAPTELAGWKHDTSLAGTPDNVGGAAFMKSSNLILGVGEKGQPIVWDVQRQKQRQRMEVLSANGQPVVYDSPVLEVVTSAAGNRAVSIHADGKIDSWNLLTGKSIAEKNTSGDQLLHVGHSPGAAFVDMAVAADAGVMVTSAVLPEKDQAERLAKVIAEQRAKGEKGEKTKRNAESNTRTWEFCKWDLNTGKMLDRWTRESETEQQISLLKSGELILYASNTETIVQEARHDGAVRFQDKTLGCFFAVENPKQKNISMHVKRSGAVRIFDSSRADGGLNNQGQRIDFDEGANHNLLSFDDYPLAGEWSPGGDRFYMVWTSGRINEFVWEGGKLSSGRDLKDSSLEKLNIGLTLNLEGKSTGKIAKDKSAEEKSNKKATKGAIRLASRWQLDLKVRNEADTNLLYLAIRLPGTEGRTRLVRVAFPPNGKGEVLASKSEGLMRLHRFVLTDTASPTVEMSPESTLPVSSGEIVATRTIGKTTYCATEGGTVYRVAENIVTAFGRPETLAGTGNATADRLVTLHQGGVLWLGDLKDGTWSWTQLATTDVNARNVKMSPDGKRLLIKVSSPTGEQSLVVAESESGKVIETIEHAQCGAWSSESELALVLSDGTVETRGAGGAKAVGNVGADIPARSIHYFTEPWKDKASTHWLAVHTQAEEGDGKLSYFGLEAAVDNGSMTLANGVNLLACSPTDGILVTGSAGVVGIHFASPSLKEYGKLLFTLEGHAGAEIKSLKFSQDGSTLITTDNRNRLFGWLSKDDLDGIEEVPEFKTNNQPIQ